MRRLVLLTPLWFPVGQALFGLWLFDWLPIGPPRWLTEGATVDPIIANPGRARALFLSLLVMISIGPFIWIDTSRLRRRSSVLALWPMARLILASRRGALTFVVLTLHFGLTAHFVSSGVPLDSYLVRTNLVLGCGMLMIVALPPTAILLAASSPVSGQLLELVARRMFPFRVVSLLDGKYLGPTLLASKHDNLRTILGRSWRESVHRLVEITPLVIVDARFATPPVREEIRYMLDARRVAKALFILNEDGSAPGLQHLGEDPSVSRLKRCRAPDVPSVIDYLKATGRVAPLVESN